VKYQYNNPDAIARSAVVDTAVVAWAPRDDVADAQQRHRVLRNRHRVYMRWSWAFAWERRLGNDGELRPLKYISHRENGRV
jgi:hypothetical protein